MFFNTITLALLASSAALAAAIPTQIEKRQNMSVKVCAHINYEDCIDLTFRYATCYSVGRLHDRVSSLDPKGHQCIFYNRAGCDPWEGQIAGNQAIANIRTDRNYSELNDDISSFQCFVR